MKSKDIQPLAKNFLISLNVFPRGTGSLAEECRSSLLFSLVNQLSTSASPIAPNNAKNKYAKIANTNVLLERVREMGIDASFIGATDLLEDDNKVFDLIWVLMCYYYRKVKAKDKEVGETEIREWAEKYREREIRLRPDEPDEIIEGDDRNLLYEESLYLHSGKIDIKPLVLGTRHPVQPPFGHLPLFEEPALFTDDFRPAALKSVPKLTKVLTFAPDEADRPTKPLALRFHRFPSPKRVELVAGCLRPALFSQQDLGELNFPSGYGFAPCAAFSMKSRQNSSPASAVGEAARYSAVVEGVPFVRAHKLPLNKTALQQLGKTRAQSPKHLSEKQPSIAFNSQFDLSLRLNLIASRHPFDKTVQELVAVRRKFVANKKPLPITTKPFTLAKHKCSYNKLGASLALWKSYFRGAITVKASNQKIQESATQIMKTYAKTRAQYANFNDYLHKLANS